MKKIITALAILILASCRQSSHHHSFHQYLSEQIKKNPHSINLSEFKEFAWDRFYIIPPYTTQKSLDSTLFVHRDRVLETDIEYSDKQCLLVFFNRDTLVSLIPVKRDLDFNSGTYYNANRKLSYFLKAESRFRLEKEACQDCYSFHKL